MHASSRRGDGQPSLLDDIATAVLDARGTVLCWSRAAEELLDRTAAEVCGKPIERLLVGACEICCRAEAAGTGTPQTRWALLRHRSGQAVEVSFRMLRLDAASLLVLATPTRRVTEWAQGAALPQALLAQDRIGTDTHGVNLPVNLPDVQAGITPEKSDVPEEPLGSWLSGVMSVKAAEEQRRQRHQNLRLEALARFGESLDVERTAQDLADVLVPALGDVGWVELAEAVFDGDEPPWLLGGGELHLRRAAVASAGPWPEALLKPGAVLPPVPDHAGLRSVQRGETVIVDRAGVIASYGDPEFVRVYVPECGQWVVAAPLFARGLLLGSVVLWRTESAQPFDQDEAELMTEIASRAALSVDNARRYTREHRAAVALQQRLLPPPVIDTPAAQTAGLYQPAGGGAEVSGDWFDVLPLPSLRTALVVGDVTGHGLAATATMGRLRTAVRTLAELELDPAELLTRADDLVQQLAGETDPEHRDVVGATCLYALYDPVTGRCTLASAGHPPPVVVGPGGAAHRIELSPGPPLGVGGMPFENTELGLEPGSVLVLYTDGLIAHHGPDLEAGMRWLTDELARLCRPGRALEEIGRALLADTDPALRDDIALLLARTRTLPAESVAVWEFPADPACVTEARTAATRQLAAWRLDELAFTTELVVSELITNAVRYAGSPIGLRLIRDHLLVCEVSDPRNTQPRLRRARISDEGGRGLFLVAQLTSRWGSRYGQSGKTIWAEQPIPLTSASPHVRPPRGTPRGA
jgi:serine phosphatase RsbU (regulator of sigma subunit)